MKKQTFTFYFNTFKVRTRTKSIRAYSPEEAYSMLSLSEKLAVEGMVDDDGNEYDKDEI